MHRPRLARDWKAENSEEWPAHVSIEISEMQSVSVAGCLTDSTSSLRCVFIITSLSARSKHAGEAAPQRRPARRVLLDVCLMGIMCPSL